MTRYLLTRILRSICSIIVVVGIVMVMIYSALDRNLIFAADSNYTHVKSNAKEVYMMQQWEKYGYLDYVPYGDYLKELLRDDEIAQEAYDEAIKFANKPEQDSELVAQYVAQFTEKYESEGLHRGAAQRQDPAATPSAIRMAASPDSMPIRTSRCCCGWSTISRIWSPWITSTMSWTTSMTAAWSSPGTIPPTAERSSLRPYWVQVPSISTWSTLTTSSPSSTRTW